MTIPTLSVHMAVRDAERYVTAAVESLLDQTYDDFELVVIDDGSRDATPLMLRRLANRDRRMRLVLRENRGVAATRNEALALARGKYFGVMDADDVARPTRFERQIAFLEANPEYVAVGSRVLLVDPEGMPIMHMGLAETHEAIDAAHLRGEGGAICHPAAILRRDAVVAVGGYHESSAEDFDLFLRLAEVGKVANLPDVLLEYRQHPRSFGYARRIEQRRSAGRALRAAYERRGLTMDPGLEYALDDVPLAGVHRKWAWWALLDGNVGTARKHAWRAVRQAPFSVDSWRAAACAARGH